MPINTNTLAQFTCTQQYHRWSILFRNFVLSDGAKYVADNGGGQGAFWLFDAIASYQPKLLKNRWARDMQFWKLVVKDQKAVLTCRQDSNIKPAVTQKIDYTDFDLPEIEFYVAQADENTYVIFLPSEY